MINIRFKDMSAPEGQRHLGSRSAHHIPKEGEIVWFDNTPWKVSKVIWRFDTSYLNYVEIEITK